jgi:DNA-binding XRE family transcriptional regulator
LAEILRKKRFEARLLQKDVAAQLGVSEDTYSFWERGKTYPMLQIASKIREYLGKDAEFLEPRFTEFKEQVWTSMQLSKMLGVNHNTFMSKLKRSKKL